jgi:hypothetical protein
MAHWAVSFASQPPKPTEVVGAANKRQRTHTAEQQDTALTVDDLSAPPESFSWHYFHSDVAAT